jgi:hypothetical protein
MDVYCDGIVNDPVGQSNQAPYDVTDDDMIDGDSSVPQNAHPPKNDK